MKTKKISDLVKIRQHCKLVLAGCIMSVLLGFLVYILFDIQDQDQIDVAQIASIVIAVTAISNNKLIDRLLFDEPKLPEKKFHKRTLAIMNA